MEPNNETPSEWKERSPTSKQLVQTPTKIPRKANNTICTIGLSANDSLILNIWPFIFLPGSNYKISAGFRKTQNRVPSSHIGAWTQEVKDLSPTTVLAI
jgi:hypothetical protein